MHIWVPQPESVPRPPPSSVERYSCMPAPSGNARRATALALPKDAEFYYKFEADGTDSTGNGHTLTGTGTPTFTPGKLGNALTLNGTSQLMSSTDNLGNEANQDISFLAWFNPTNHSVAARPILYKQGPPPDWRLVWETTQAVSFKVDDAGTIRTVTSQTGLADNAWHLAIALVDSVAKTINLVVDNVTATPVSYTTAINATGSTFFVGRDTQLNSWFLGQIDTVAAYRRLFTGAEIAAFWNGSAGADAF
jgi:hypothetical protein